MRHLGFPQSLAASLGSVVVGLWLGQIGLALAQTNNPEQWACYPPHPKWGLYPDPLTSATDQEKQGGNPIAPQGHSDPTSTQHPDWDGLPAEESWLPQSEVAESKESSALLTSTPETEASSETHQTQQEDSVGLPQTSDSLAEIQHAPSSYAYEDEVQSMEEYFQRYGRTYAGSERNEQGESQTISSDVSSNYTDTAAEPEEEQFDSQAESEETSLKNPGADSDASAKKSDDANADDEKEDQAEEKEDREAAEELETSEDAEKTRNPAEDAFPVEKEKEDISSEQQESDGSENDERKEGNPSEGRNESPQQEGTQGDLPQEQGTPAGSPKDQNRDGSSESEDNSSEAFSPWGYEPGYERVEAEYTPPSEPGTTSPTEQNRNLSDNTSSSEGLAEQKHLTPPDESLPQDRYEYPEQQWQEGKENDSLSATHPLEQSEAASSHEDSSGQDNRGQPNENESSWSDIPAQEPYPSNPSVNRPETSQYEWRLENPDTWSETTSPQTRASLSPAAEDSNSAHPSLLEGLGRGVLRLLEPWRKTVSGLLDISGAVEGFTKTFPIGEETPPQQGAAALPAETMAR